MSALLQFSINFSAFNTPRDDSNKKKIVFESKFSEPTDCYPFSRTNICSFHQNGFRMVLYKGRLSLKGLNMGRDGILVQRLNDKEEKKMKQRMVLVQGFGFNGGGGSGRDNSDTARVLGNLAVAIGLTYLTMTDQLGWVLDAIVSFGLLRCFYQSCVLELFFGGWDEI